MFGFNGWLFIVVTNMRKDYFERWGLSEVSRTHIPKLSTLWKVLPGLKWTQTIDLIKIQLLFWMLKVWFVYLEDWNRYFWPQSIPSHLQRHYQHWFWSDCINFSSQSFHFTVIISSLSIIYYYYILVGERWSSIPLRANLLLSYGIPSHIIIDFFRSNQLICCIKELKPYGVQYNEWLIASFIDSNKCS